MNGLIARLILTVMLVAMSAPFAFAVDPPHDPAAGITCANCHYSGSTINSIGFYNFCSTCHQPNGMAQLHSFSPNDASNIFNNVTSKRTGLIMQTSHNWGGGLVVPKAGAVKPVAVQLNYAPLVGLSCARCHNIHGPQQSATNSKPFLRMLNDSDQMCLDCHSPRNTTNQTTGSHPVTMTYTSAIKKFARYTTKFYPTPVNANPNNVTSAMNLNKGGKLLCSTCHGTHFADSNSATFDNASSVLLGRLVPGDGFLLRTDMYGAAANNVNICTNCHKGKYAHNGKNQNIQCADCHAGHVDEADGTKANVWLVRRYMSYSTGTYTLNNRLLNKPTFFQSTTVKNYRDANNTGVCQSCHALPANVPEHSQADVNCNGCHFHDNPKGSFAAVSCNGCHGQPPSQNVAGGPDGYAAGYNGVNEALSAHSSHVSSTGYNYTCNDCHKGYAHQDGNFQDVFLSPAGTTAGTNGATPAYNTTARTCATTYCHSNGAPRGGVIAYPAAVAWANGKGSIIGTTGECAACHGSSATLATNAHSKHVNSTTGKGYACEVCHAATITGSTTIKDKTRHVDGFKNISFSATTVSVAAGTTWNTASATCATACHSNGKGVQSVPNWTSAATGACGSCHKATGTTPMDTNAHLPHLNGAYGPLLGTAVNACQGCHTYTTDIAVTHVNGAVDNPVSNCTTSCHKNGITVVDWSKGRVTCESCHTGSLSVINTVTAPNKSLNATKGHGQSTFTGTPTCQSCHDANAPHISGILGDAVRLTLANTNAQCASCHNNAGKIKPAFYNMSTHFTTKGGPQDMLCKSCHDPHGTSNLSMIKTQLKGAWANATTYTIVYTDAVNGFVNSTTNRGLCQVCHTKTNHFKAGVPETGHPTTGCLNCHQHNASGGAFKPKGTCDACHGYPPAPRNVANLTFGATGNYLNAAFDDYSGGGGAHLIGDHIPATATADQGWVNCVLCHNNGAADHKMLTPIKTNIANVTVVVDPAVKFNPAKQISYTGARLVSSGSKTGRCSNVECHFQSTPQWSKLTAGNVPPTVVMTSPSTGASFTAPATITLAATATDVDGTISKVEYFNGATLVGSSTIAPFSFNWLNVAAGNYTITAKATDNLGGVTTSAAVAVTVRTNVAPSVSLTAPANGATYIAPASVSLTASASDTDGTISKVEFYNGSTLLGTTTTAPYSFAWNGVGVGTYTLTARAYDNLNAVTTSAAAIISVSAVNQPPTVTLTAPANGSIFVAPATINLTASAVDSDGTVSKVEYFNGATLIGTATTAPFSFTWSNVAVGTYSITAKATDNLGGTATSLVSSVTVNANQPPTVTLTGPTNGSTYTAPASIPLTATASDTDGTISKVEFYNGATLLGTDTAAPYSFTWSAVGVGTYNITSKAYDNLNAVTTSAAVTVTVNAPNQPPVVAVTAPANGATYLAPATVTFSVGASDPDGTIAKVEFYNGSNLLATSSTAPYSFTWVNVAAGTYSLSAKAYDNLNAVTTSASVSVTVNQPPTVALTAPTNGASFTAPATITTSASASDADGTISKVEFYNGATLLATATAAPYSFTWSGVAAGTYTITAKAYDNLSAVTTSAAAVVTVSVPNQPPTVALTAPANGATFTAPATISLSAAAGDSDGTISKVEFYNGATLLGSTTTSPYAYSWSGVAVGTYTLTAKAYDNLNAVTTSTSVTVTVNPAPVRGNVALAANGGVATASSVYSATAAPAAAIINGDRKGLKYNAGGVWYDATNGVYPDWVQINFNGTKTIDEVDVFTVQDTLTAPLEPTTSMIFTLYGVTGFTVQYWNGSAWVAIPGATVTGNNLVWKTVTFAPVVTDRIRVQINSSIRGYSRLAEVEVYGL